MITNRWLTDNAEFRRICGQNLFLGYEAEKISEKFNSFDGNAVYLVIYKDNIPAAAALCYISANNQYVLHDIAYVRELRSQDAADLIVRLFIARCVKCGAADIIIHAHRSDISFYEEFGFRRGAEHDSDGERIVMHVSPEDATLPRECEVSAE